MVIQNIIIVLWWLTMHAKLYFNQYYGLYCVNSKIYCVLQCLGALNSWSGRWMLDDVCKSDVWPVGCIYAHACGASYATQLPVPIEYHHKHSGQCRVTKLSILRQSETPAWGHKRHVFEKYRHVDLCVYTHLRDLSHGPHDQAAKTGQEISFERKRSILETILNGKSWQYIK